MPRSREQDFVGHARELWQVVRALITRRAFGNLTSCAVQGAGGSGKSQLAAEFVARYGARFFPGGIVWTSAEGDDASLTAQWRGVWSTLAPGEPDPSAAAGDNQTLARLALGSALRQRLERHPAPHTVLWVVDGMPEGGGEPATVRAWCPAIGVTSVLVTTRRAGLEGVQEHVAVGALSPASGLALLTRPPVDRRWLPDDDWRGLVQWVGGLPLALTILQASLADGFTTAQALSSARADEASNQLDAEMDALRDEVADTRLRGVTRTFAFSFEALGVGSPLQQACRMMALLSGAPIAETLLARLMDQRMIGRLAKRGWIEPVGDGGIRRWTMHRVAASFLRVHGGDLDPVFAMLFERLRAIDFDALPGAERYALGWQVVHVRKRLDKCLDERRPMTAAREAAHRFAVDAAGTPPTEESVGWRYLAASIGASVGADDDIVDRLTGALATADEERVAFVPQVLQPLQGAAVGALMRRLLDDERQLIRVRAIVHAAALHDLDVAPTLLRRLLEFPNANLRTHFDDFLQAECPDVRVFISDLMRAANDMSSPTRRQRAVELLGRTLAVNARDFRVGGFNSINIAGALAGVALRDPDEEVAQAAVSAASVRFEPQVQAIFANAYATAQDEDTRCRIVRYWGDYLEGAQRPAPPQGEWVEHEDEGRSLRVSLPERGPASPFPDDAYDPLIDIARGDGKAAECAARVIAQRDSGTTSVYRALEEAFEAGAFERVTALADRLLDADASFAAARWWRARARHKLGDADGALSDLTLVEERMPDFAPLFSIRGEILADRGDFEAAIAPLQRALGVEPGDFVAHQRLWYALSKLGRFVEAEAAASRAIEHLPGSAEPWYDRAVARAAIGRIGEAVIDLQHAATLEPGNDRVRAALARFQGAQQGE